MTEEEANEKTVITAQCSRGLSRKVRVEAAKKGLSMSAFLRGLIEKEFNTKQEDQ